MKVFKTRWFNKWAKKEKISDAALQKQLSELLNLEELVEVEIDE